MKNNQDGGTPTSIEIEAIELSEQYINSKDQTKTRKGSLFIKYNPNLDSAFGHLAISGGHNNLSPEMCTTLGITESLEIDWESVLDKGRKAFKKPQPTKANIVRTSSISDTKKTTKKNKPDTNEDLTKEDRLVNGLQQLINNFKDK